MEQVPVRPDGLQLDEHRRFQERFWTAQRIAWGVFAVILLAALAGFTGAGGPMSNGSRDLGGARVEYPAISRWATPDTLKMHLAGPGTQAVTLGPGFVDGFEVDTITPEPETAATSGEGLRLEFRVEGRDAVPVVLKVRPVGVGLVRYGVAVEGAGSASLATLVLP